VITEEAFKEMSLKEKLGGLFRENATTEQQRREDTWMGALDSLYEDITKNWFKEYIEEDYIEPEFYYVESEQYEYYSEIVTLELHIPGEFSIVFEPAGINVRDAFGKINLYVRGHKEEKISLLLVRDDGDGEKLHWEVWKSRKQKEGIPFDKDAFEKLLDGWLERWANIERDSR